MLPTPNYSKDERECGCNKCKLKGWKTVSRKTYARHREAREQSQFSPEFQQFLQDARSSTQVPASIPTTPIPSTSTSKTIPLVSSSNDSSRPPTTIEDLSMDVSMMSLGRCDDEDDGNGGDEDEGDEKRKANSCGEVGDMSVYIGDNDVEVSSLSSPSQNIHRLLLS